MDIVAFSIAAFLGGLLGWPLGKRLARWVKKDNDRPSLTLVDPHQLDITDLAEWAESRGPRGAA